MDKVVKILSECDTFAISAHTNPDGDALGSAFALCYGLKKIGKQVDIYFDDEVPDIYRGYFDNNLVNRSVCDNKEYDALVILDVSNIDRIKLYSDLVKHCKKIVNIDHHEFNLISADAKYVDPLASASAEIVYDALNKMGIDFDEKLATYIYIGILTDTGGFKYSSTSSKTLKIASDMIGFGVKVDKIYKDVFDTYSYEKISLLKLAFQTIDIVLDGKVAFMLITDDMLKKANASYAECSGIVDFARRIQGVEVGFLIVERELGVFKVSLRANEYIDVSEIAVDYCGGGHKKASGFSIKSDSIFEVRDIVLNAVKNKLDEYEKGVF